MWGEGRQNGDEALGIRQSWMMVGLLVCAWVGESKRALTFEVGARGMKLG